VAAIFEIVTFHAAGERVLGFGFGLPCFLIFMTALAARKRDAQPFGEFSRIKLIGILRPWVFWFAVYAAIKVGAALYDGRPPLGWWGWETPLYGPVPHLWYLPFAAGALLAVNRIQHWVRSWSDGVVVATMVAWTIGLMLIATSLLAEPDLGTPLTQWAFGMASIPLGIAIGRAFSTGNLASRAKLLLPTAAALLLALALWHDLPGRTTVMPRYAIIGAFTCLLFMRPLQIKLPVGAIAKNTFGIYLLHPLFLMAGGRFVGSSHWHPVLAAAAAFVLAFAASALFRRTRFARFV
jgi:surface polysaccharide O-acyltransferase-like enzyme